MQGIFQKENTDKALKYGIYRHLPTYEKIIRNLVSFLRKKICGDDAQSVGDNTELEDIAKMPIDIELLNLRISRSMRRHGTIGSFIRIIGFIKALSFRVCLKLFDDPVSILGIIFGNKCFYAGRIKDGHIRFCRVNRLTDRLGNINKVIGNKLEVI